MSGGEGLRHGVRAAVTGGGRGIGEAVARRFARDGARVTILDRDLELARKASSEIPGSAAHELDVSDAGAVERIFEEAAEPFEIVVANAGVGMGRITIDELDVAEWHRVISVNLTGVFLTVRGAARRMIRDGIEGRIIVTASISGLVPEPGSSPYAAAKFGVVGLVRTCANELADKGVLLNAVCPGDVDTALLAEFFQDPDHPPRPFPLNRPASPDEIAGVYAFLAGKDASYMVGSTVVVDGGIMTTTLT
jgi:NAD(P)-dependent dehydrogenase (short-subunit alcohol dehydrogenase family)